MNQPQHLTLVGNFSKLRVSPTLRFVVFGATSDTLVQIGSAQAEIR